MKKLAAHIGVLFCGIVTSVLVAFVNTKIIHATDFSVVDFWFFFIVPLGAIGAGLLAASGFYAGALWFNHRTSTLLLLEMLAIAACTMLLIYWLGYQNLLVDGGKRVADYVPFGDFLHLYFTAGNFKMGPVDLGSMGVLGYAWAILQFGGFMLGAWLVALTLEEKNFCEPCHRYRRKLAAPNCKSYAGGGLAEQYLQRLGQVAPGSSEFAALFRDDPNAAHEHGAFRVETALLACPACSSQVLAERVQVFSDKKWKDLPAFKRALPVPPGVDARPLFAT